MKLKRGSSDAFVWFDCKRCDGQLGIAKDGRSSAHTVPFCKPYETALREHAATLSGWGVVITEQPAKKPN